MSRQEIDDVLSSVRRLVAREASRVPADRLVLTPALRVTPEAGPENERAPKPAPADGTAPGATAADAPSRSRDLSSPVSSAVSDAATRQEVETGASVKPAAPGPLPTGTADTTRADTAQQGAHSVDLEHLRATLDALEIAAAGGQMPVDDDEGDDDVNNDAVTTSVDDAEAADGRVGHDDDGMQRVDADPAAQRRHETPVGNRDASAVTSTATQPRGGDRVEPGAGAGSIAAALPDDAADQPMVPPALGAETEMLETVIDEDMLRVLVSQIVREELRGQLGARVTMQVRKLVRAEVTRLLEERPYI